MKWIRVTGWVAAAWLLLGIAAPISGNAGDRQLIRGIVDYTEEEILSIGKHRYNIAGVPVRNADGKAAERGDALRGQLVEIRYFKGKIVSVTVSRPMHIDRRNHEILRIDGIPTKAWSPVRRLAILALLAFRFPRTAGAAITDYCRSRRTYPEPSPNAYL